MTAEQTQFDVVVIGAGIGGYVAAIRATQLGARVAIVEKQYIGGTCLNVGCIPSKALIHVAQLYSQFHELEKMGIHVKEAPSFDMATAVAYKDKVVKQLTGGVAQLLRANNVAVFEGTAQAVSPNRVQIDLQDGTSREIETKKLILANGSVTIRPPFPRHRWLQCHL